MGCGGSKEPAAGGAAPGGAEVSVKGKFGPLKGLFIIDKEQVGDGATASVHLCTSVKTGERAACKVMRFEEGVGPPGRKGEGSTKNSEPSFTKTSDRGAGADTRSQSECGSSFLQGRPVF